MNVEQFTNFGRSTLNGGINDTTTSILVVSALSFPTTGNFRLRIDNEILKVTGVFGSTFTVERGKEGTTAASHTNGAAVTHVVTAEVLEITTDHVILASADETLVQVAIQDDDELVFPVKANEKWWVEVMAVFTHTDMSRDLEAGFSVPSGATLTYGAQQWGGSSWDPGLRTSTPVALLTATDTRKVNSNHFGSQTIGAVIKGLLENGANAGDFRFRWGIFDTSASSTAVRKAGSFMRAVRVG